MRIIYSGLAAIACLMGANFIAKAQTLTLMRGPTRRITMRNERPGHPRPMSST